MSHLNRINPSLKTGNETFVVQGNPLDYNLLRFWQWSSSDLISNTLSGILAECIVAIAIG